MAAIPLLVLVSMTCFVVIQLPPGDFASKYKSDLIQRSNMPEQEAEKQAQTLRARYGLDKPLVIQYFYWIKGIVTKGNFGHSFAYNKDVGELIAKRMPRTSSSFWIRTFVP